MPARGTHYFCSFLPSVWREVNYSRFAARYIGSQGLHMWLKVARVDGDGVVT